METSDFFKTSNQERISKRLFIAGYLILLFIHLISGWQQFLTLQIATKPLLLFSLSLYFYLTSKRFGPGRFIKNIQLGLLFSLVGDVLLIFDTKTFFIAGLIAFLLAHVFYIMAFIIDSPYTRAQLKRTGFICAGVIGYSTFYFLSIKDNLDKMAIPVFLYISVITVMLLAAINRYKRVGQLDYWLIVLGALFFVVSDSVLAWNKFMDPINNAHLWIMSTYGIAQLLITMGAIEHSKKL